MTIIRLADRGVRRVLRLRLCRLLRAALGHRQVHAPRPPRRHDLHGACNRVVVVVVVVVVEEEEVEVETVIVIW